MNNGWWATADDGGRRQMTVGSLLGLGVGLALVAFVVVFVSADLGRKTPARSALEIGQWLLLAAAAFAAAFGACSLLHIPASPGVMALLAWLFSFAFFRFCIYKGGAFRPDEYGLPWQFLWLLIFAIGDLLKDYHVTLDRIAAFAGVTLAFFFTGWIIGRLKTGSRVPE